MKKRSVLITGSAAIACVLSTTAMAQTEPTNLTLCWAAWDPANALVELSKDFEQRTGHNMNYEFIPWPNFANQMLNELANEGQTCDLLIGDSQWIGGGAENGHYVKLNDFFDTNDISMDDFIPATVTGYAEWPKNTPNYYALPAFGDVLGWTYRKDWFERPEIRAAFQSEYGRELEVPTSLQELSEIGAFFQDREIDGKTIYGAAIFTERGSEGITMGVNNILYNFGFQYENPDNPYELEGYVNSAGAAAGLEFYKNLYETVSPPGSSNWYLGEAIGAYASGQVAMQMSYAFIWPSVEADLNVGHGKSGYFPNPPGPAGQFAQLGGQGISVVSYSQNREAALEYIGWFSQPEVQAEWWNLGGYSALQAVVDDPDFATSQPYAQTFLDSMALVKDFWAEPAYSELLVHMQHRVHDFVVNDEGTAQEALDGLVADWTAVFEKEGRL